MTVYTCPKCKSGAEVVTDNDGFIKAAKFDKYKKFSEFELRRLEVASNGN